VTVIPFCGGSYVDKTLNANAQDCINLYPMKTKMAEYSDKKISYSLPEKIIMYPTPGYKYLRTPGMGAIRALYVINTTLYIISGNTLYSFTPTGTSNDLTQGSFNNLGTLNTSTGWCSIVSNTIHLVISDGQYGYTLIFSSNSFAQISTGGGFPSAGVTNFAYYDSYVIAAQNNSKTVWQSNILDATTWQALAYDTIVSFSDNISGVWSDELQLYVMGPKITEVQIDVGTIPYAFQKVPNVLIQAGLVAPATLAKVANTTFFLASDIAGKAYVGAFNSYDTKVISTPPINEAIERYTTISDAFAYAYREGDNHFYVITFPSANATWAYDIKMDMWHKRSIAGGADLPVACVLWQGIQIVGDSAGNLYQMSQDFSYYSVGNTGVDNPMQRSRTTAHLNSEYKTLFINELQVNIQMGDGFISDSKLSPQPTASAPLVTLQVSRDFGNTWRTIGTRSMGVQGAYQQRLIWRNLGRFRQNATFRLNITDPVKVFIIGAEAKIKVGVK
jgi:hypothetical protein